LTGGRDVLVLLLCLPVDQHSGAWQGRDVRKSKKARASPLPSGMASCYIRNAPPVGRLHRHLFGCMGADYGSFSEIPFSQGLEQCPPGMFPKCWSQPLASEQTLQNGSGGFRNHNGQALQKGWLLHENRADALNLSLDLEADSPFEGALPGDDLLEHATCGVGPGFPEESRELPKGRPISEGGLILPRAAVLANSRCVPIKDAPDGLPGTGGRDVLVLLLCLPVDQHSRA
jgi:hypothetical protein